MFAKLYKFIPYLLGNIPYLLSYCFKKDPELWLFGAWHGEKYSDNSKYLFEYLLKNKLRKCFWITKNKLLYKALKRRNIPVLYRLSWQGLYYTLKARVVVVSTGLYDINNFCLINSQVFKVHLWHGIGNKNIGCKYKSNVLKIERMKRILFPYVSFNRYGVPLIIRTQIC